MPNEQTRNIVVYLGLVRWEPSVEEQALEEFARTGVRSPVRVGPNDPLLKMRALLVRQQMELLCDFLARFYDGLAEVTGANPFRIQSKVRFYNHWARAAAAWDSTSETATIERRLGAKRDEVEVTIFTGRKKLFMGDEVAATFSMSLGDGSAEDEERCGAAFNRAVARINAGSK